MLTAKREKYVRGLVSGLSQRQAYKEAYPNANKWKPETIDNKASKLFKDSEVLARYNELMNEHKEKALWTREEAVNHLKWLIGKTINSIESEEFDNGYVRQGTSGALISAIQELNKMEDIYPSEKKDVNLSGSVAFIEDVPIDD